MCGGEITLPRGTPSSLRGPTASAPTGTAPATTQQSTVKKKHAYIIVRDVPDGAHVVGPHVLVVEVGVLPDVDAEELYWLSWSSRGSSGWRTWPVARRRSPCCSRASPSHSLARRRSSETVSFSSASKLPKSAWDSRRDGAPVGGAPPPSDGGARFCQKMEWFRWPPPKI